MPTPRIVCLVCYALCAAACSGEGDGGQAPPTPQPLSLILGVKETFLSPRDIQRVAVTAYPTPGDSITDAYFLFGGGFLPDSISLPMYGDQPQVGYVDFTVPVAPITVTITVHAVVRTQAQESALDTVFAIGDDGVPEVGLSIHPMPYLPGDTIVPHCAGWDRSGFVGGSITIHGAVDTTTSAWTTLHEQSWGMYLLLPLAPTLSVGDQLIVSCSLTDIYGHTVSPAWDTVTLGP